MSRIRVATYNVHDCLGRDGLYHPDRVAHVLAALKVDLIALQEVTLDRAGALTRLFESVTGMTAVDGSLFDRGVGRYGNLLLTRFAVRHAQLHDISHPGREPRGLIDAEVKTPVGVCRVFSTHLGLRQQERSQQIASIRQAVAEVDGLTILLGDFNVWSGKAALAPIVDIGFHHRRVRSFPTWPLPLVPLDRIFVRGPAEIVRCERYVAKPASRASDHFPVTAELLLHNAATAEVR